jgi:hypothetical protein
MPLSILAAGFDPAYPGVLFVDPARPQPITIHLTWTDDAGHPVPDQIDLVLESGPGRVSRGKAETATFVVSEWTTTTQLCITATLLAPRTLRLQSRAELELAQSMIRVLQVTLVVALTLTLALSPQLQRQLEWLSKLAVAGAGLLSVATPWGRKQLFNPRYLVPLVLLSLGWCVWSYFGATLIVNASPQSVKIDATHDVAPGTRMLVDAELQASAVSARFRSEHFRDGQCRIGGLGNAGKARAAERSDDCACRQLGPSPDSWWLDGLLPSMKIGCCDILAKQGPERSEILSRAWQASGECRPDKLVVEDVAADAVLSGWNRAHGTPRLTGSFSYEPKILTAADLRTIRLIETLAKPNEVLQLSQPLTVESYDPELKQLVYTSLASESLVLPLRATERGAAAWATLTFSMNELQVSRSVVAHLDRASCTLAAVPRRVRKLTARQRVYNLSESAPSAAVTTTVYEAQAPSLADRMPLCYEEPAADRDACYLEPTVDGDSCDLLLDVELDAGFNEHEDWVLKLPSTRCQTLVNISVAGVHKGRASCTPGTPVMLTPRWLAATPPSGAWSIKDDHEQEVWRPTRSKELLLFTCGQDGHRPYRMHADAGGTWSLAENGDAISATRELEDCHFLIGSNMELQSLADATRYECVADKALDELLPKHCRAHTKSWCGQRPVRDRK